LSDPEHADQVERRAVAAGNLRIDAATAEVLTEFEAAGVESRLLKGASISQWLFHGRRGYMDCDLWIRPGAEEQAEGALVRLGFEKHTDEGGLPDWWQEHGSDWVRSLDGVCVDLHRTLPGIGVDPESAWATLAPDAEIVEVGRRPAQALGKPGRALHIALHAAHHGAGWRTVLVDLERAVEQVDERVWADAAALADQLAATDAFGAGLRLIPAGEALADRLGLPENQSVEVAIHARTSTTIALGFDQLSRAHGPRAKAEVLARKVVPPPGFMRHWYPPAGRSRWQLAFAYLYRPVWLVINAPRGWRAWREARRSVQAGSD